MERHLLLTVSEQKSALFGVKFVGHFFKDKDKIKITLFYTAPRPPAIWEDDKSKQSLLQMEKYARQNEERGRHALENAKKTLIQFGFKEDLINTSLKIRRQSKAMDIIHEANKGLYDALVLGGRGLSWMEQAFDENVSRELLKKECDFPLWICRRPEFDRKDILLCIDGSDSAFRMADHLGFMLGKEKDRNITIFHVLTKQGILSKQTEKILENGTTLLLNSGFDKGLIKIKVIKNNNAAKSIIKEAEDGLYAAVAVGRTGINQGFLKKTFMGGVCDALFRVLEKAALFAMD